MSKCPNYLKEYENIWNEDPKAANLEWFRNAGIGLFLHYGLYSQLGRHEWVMLREQIPVDEYEKLFDSFDPKNFNADEITDLALEAGMSYVNLTTCHHEGFCLWDSVEESFNSVKASGRDLVRELAEACDRKGLGFFCYFTHLLNWRHPYALTTDLIPMTRPDYPTVEARYKLTEPEEWRHYWDWAHNCLKELCSLEYPVAGIWLDLIIAYYLQPDLVPLQETYRIIRDLRPETLLAFKQGGDGTEDFASPEFKFASMAVRMREEYDDERGALIAQSAWDSNKNKHNEICMTLQQSGWGWMKDVEHKDADTIWRNIAYAHSHNCNLLINTGPLPDGSLHPEDVATLKEIGRRYRESGWPRKDEGLVPDHSDGAGGQ